MIVNFSMKPKKVLKPTFINLDMENFGFALVCIDRDSYIVSSIIESGINIAKDGVHNI